jgi:hypothetical protein
LTAGDVTGDGRVELIGSWANGIWYWDFVASAWTQMTADVTTGDIAAGDFTGDGRADVASSWDDGLWYQDGDTLAWIKIDPSPAYCVFRRNPSTHSDSIRPLIPIPFVH